MAVKPTGLPSELFSVITQTPEAWRLKDCFRASVVSVSFSMIALSFLGSRLTQVTRAMSETVASCPKIEQQTGRCQ